jgi:glycosyltransferase involved in cell wall biosynthesis
MAKWLRRLGHEVEVLTTSAYGDDGNEHTHRTPDAQLWRARLRGKERIDALFDADTYAGRPHLLSKLVVPEPLLVAWAPFARGAARRLHRQDPFDCVITTSPPESIHAVGRSLRRLGLPWVADIRDAWTFESLRPRFPTGAQRRLDAHLERRWLRAADVVVCVSEPAARDLRGRKVADPLVVPNGWDPEERAPEPPPSSERLDPQRVSLVYTGRFGSYGRDPRPLVEGFERLSRENSASAARLELVVAGPLSEAEAKLFATDVSPARIVVAGSLPRPEALALQGEADALLLLAQPTRSQLLNLKLFEYMASGRPILALAAGTEAGRIVSELGGEVTRADDPQAIAAALGRLVEAPPAPPPAEALAPYTYPAPAEGMADAIERAIAAAGRGR